MLITEKAIFYTEQFSHFMHMCVYSAYTSATHVRNGIYYLLINKIYEV